jgi:hypothetical protein
MASQEPWPGCLAASAFQTLLLCFVSDNFFFFMVSEHWRSINQRECGVRQISSLQARIFIDPWDFYSRPIRLIRNNINQP